MGSNPIIGAKNNSISVNYFFLKSPPRKYFLSVRLLTNLELNLFTDRQKNSSTNQHIPKIIMNSNSDETLNTNEIKHETINEIPTSYNLPKHNQKLAILVKKLFIKQGRSIQFKISIAVIYDYSGNLHHTKTTAPYSNLEEDLQGAVEGECLHLID